MTKLEKILKVTEREISKENKGFNTYSGGYYDGIVHARREIKGIIEKQDSLKDFFMTRLGMSIYDVHDVRYVMNGVTVEAPDWSDLDKYHLEDYKEVDDIFYLFIDEKE